MDVSYLGHSCFSLKGKQVKVVCDPFGKSVGFSQSKAAAQIVTISHDHGDHSDLSRVTGEYITINGPGEYEIKGVSVLGMQTFHDENKGKDRGKNTVYAIDIDNIRVVHLGDLGHKLTEKQIDKLDGVDVLLVGVGGESAISPKQAWEVVKQISPSIVVPMHYKTKEHDAKWKNKAGVEEFVKITGMEAKKENRLSLKKLDLPEEMELVVLEKK